MKKAKKKAQAGLEYLMTYGWALVLIASIIGVFVILIGTPTGQISFTSSEPTKMPVKGSSYDTAKGFVEIILQNITGGGISITKVTLDNAVFYGCKLNGTTFTSGADISPAINVIAGGEMRFTEIKYVGSGAGKIEIDYKDYANMVRKVTVSGTKQGRGAYCGDGYCTGSEDNYTCPSDCPPY
jgi:hypothetical protein